jgi:hypothetical protein
MPTRLPVRSIMVREAPPSAWRIARTASTSLITALFLSISDLAAQAK